MGSYLYQSASLLPHSFNRIEMIRGPGSALYGSDAFHGVLSLRSYEGVENEVNSSLTLTDDTLWMLNANASYLINENHRFNFTVTKADQDDRDTSYVYQPPIGLFPADAPLASSSRIDGYDALNLFLKLHSNFTENIQSTFGVYTMQSDRDGAVGFGRNLTGISSLQDRDITDGENDVLILKHELSWNLPQDLVFQSKVYYWEQENILVSDAIRLINFQSEVTLDEETLGVDLLIKQQENAFNTQWAIGLSYKDNEITDQESVARDINFDFLFDLPDESVGFERDVKSVILEARTKFADDSFHVLYGGRFDEYSDFGNQTSPRVGFIYLQDEFSVKLLYGEAFRAPVTTEIRGSNTLRGSEDLNPEVIETTELVFMIQKEHWKANITFFQSEWTDGIVIQPLAIPVDGFFTEYVNVGENESDGIEISFIGDYQKTWSWDLSASYVESEGEQGTFSFDYVAFPKYIVNINGGYRFSDTLQFYMTNRLQIDTNDGPITGLISETDELDDLFITSITAQWAASSSLELDFSIINLFDEDTLVPSVWNSEFGVDDSTLMQRFQVALRYQF
ncbi:MAG: TonB-dependent receptor [Pseudomonadota bacterium]